MADKGILWLDVPCVGNERATRRKICWELSRSRQGEGEGEGEVFTLPGRRGPYCVGRVPARPRKKELEPRILFFF